MALSRVGGSSAAANSIAIPAHQAGDLIVVWAYRDGNTTPPTVPAAGGTVPSFTVIDNPTGANTNSAVCAYAVAAGTTDTSGTWTNATGMSVEVWRGAGSPPIGGHAQSGGSVASGGNIAIPAITLTDNSGSSTILAFAGWQTVTAWNAAPTGYTQQSQVATECEALSKNSTTADGAFNVSGTASATGGTRTQQVEIIADFGNRVSQQAVEALYSTSGAKARASQEAVEVLGQGVTNARVSQAAVEVLRTSTVGAKNRVSQVAVEVLQSRAVARDVPFIGSTTTPYTPLLNGAISLDFIASVTALYTPTLQGYVTVPFIGSSTALYTPTLVHGSTQVDVPFIASATVVYGMALPTEVPSATLVLASDGADIYPLAGENASLQLLADDPQLSGAIQAESGALSFGADAPSLLNFTTPASGVLILRGEPPHLFASTKPSSGRLLLKGDAPTIYPLAAPSGKMALAATGPLIVPTPSAAGRLLFAAQAPTVYPLTAPSGSIVFKAGNPTLSNASYIFEESGILRLRSDIPIVTPLTEPTPPPEPAAVLTLSQPR